MNYDDDILEKTRNRNGKRSTPSIPSIPDVPDQCAPVPFYSTERFTEEYFRSYSVTVDDPCDEGEESQRIVVIGLHAAIPWEMNLKMLVDTHTALTRILKTVGRSTEGKSKDVTEVHVWDIETQEYLTKEHLAGKDEPS